MVFLAYNKLIYETFTQLQHRQYLSKKGHKPAGEFFRQKKKIEAQKASNGRNKIVRVHAATAQVTD
jgi:hypothetical protein